MHNREKNQCLGFLFPMFLCVCMVCRYVHVCFCMFMGICVDIYVQAWGQCLESSSSTSLIETDPVSETQNLLPQLFLLASLLWASPVSIFQGRDYIYVGSGGLHTCEVSTLTRALSSTLNDCFIASH